MGQIAKAAAGKPQQQQDGIRAMLTANWERIQSVMPKHMNSERLYQLALSAINTTPGLAQCDAASLDADVPVETVRFAGCRRHRHRSLGIGMQRRALLFHSTPPKSIGNKALKL